jgi:hydrogenase maturation protein HypF
VIAPACGDRRRLALEVHGAVQGVGFRPWVYRVARALELDGWVVNDVRGLRVEVEGAPEAVDGFRRRLETEPPAHAVIGDVTERWLEPTHRRGFAILASDRAGEPTVTVLPDLAACPACLAELADPADRRHGYPFINCTECGPRFSIVRELPYDRPNTTMAGFALCPACAAEYRDPLDRRFHAQPNACPVCGPHLAWWDADGRPLAPDPVPRVAAAISGTWNDGGLPVSADADAVASAAHALREGHVVAVQGLGGFQLACDATDEAAVAALRARKGRPSKPLAVMVLDVEAAARLCHLPPGAAELLSGPEAPIVLLPRRTPAGVAASVAPGHGTLGVMLAYTPLHRLLLEAVRRPLVATSGNRSEEPICTDPAEAVVRLREIADRFLVHDRPIERHVDDSVAWIVDGAPRLLRRARGWAPLPVRLAREVPPLLAAGAHLKSAVALARGREAWIGQHVGDLETPEARAAYERVVRDLVRLYRVRPAILAHDLHPDYVSTRLAIRALAAAHPGGPPPRTLAVQHHHAHLVSVLAEHGMDGRALGIVWDGTGYGPDGTVWGGELLVGDAASYRRAGHLRPFRLAGGEAAVREPRRVALALLREAVTWPAGLDELPPLLTFRPDERRVLERVLERGVASPITTSAGRLLDGVASLLGLVHRNRYEGEGAVALEQCADPSERGAYDMPLHGAGDGPFELDWRPAVAEAARDVQRGVAPGRVSARMHRALVAGMVRAATAVGEERVALSGGCFQNRILVEQGARALRAGGFQVLLNRQVPPNDGGIALGQAAVAAAALGPDSASEPG